MVDKADSTELQGIGGWLAFLIVILGLVTPLRIILMATVSNKEIMEVADLLGSGSETYVTFNWVVCALSALVSIAVAIRLANVHRWSSVKICIAGLWGMAVLPGLSDLAMSAILFPKLAGGALPDVALGIGQSSISATLWTAYLLRSKRVANTYIRDLSDTQRIFG